MVNVVKQYTLLYCWPADVLCRWAFILAFFAPVIHAIGQNSAKFKAHPIAIIDIHVETNHVISAYPFILTMVSLQCNNGITFLNKVKCFLTGF